MDRVPNLDRFRPSDAHRVPVDVCLTFGRSVCRFIAGREDVVSGPFGENRRGNATFRKSIDTYSKADNNDLDQD
jgi:hypothetical protein